jgi:hypothetical protein
LGALPEWHHRAAPERAETPVNTPVPASGYRASGCTACFVGNLRRIARQAACMIRKKYHSACKFQRSSHETFYRLHEPAHDGRKSGLDDPTARRRIMRYANLNKFDASSATLSFVLAREKDSRALHNVSASCPPFWTKYVQWPRKADLRI